MICHLGGFQNIFKEMVQFYAINCIFTSKILSFAQKASNKKQFQMNNVPDKNLQTVQLIAKMTQKLAKTYKQIHEMSLQFLKVLVPPSRNQRRGIRNRDKQKTEDLNSNLLNGDQQEINGMISRKKIKPNKRIQEAEQDIEQEFEAEKPPQKGFKKNEQKTQKKHELDNNDDNKKKAKIISHKPKAPTSSFLLFFKQQQHSIAKSYPNYGVVQLTKVAAKCWNELSVEQKEPYQKLFEAQRRKYQQQMEKYRRQFPEEVLQKQLQKKERKKKKAKQRRQRSPKQHKQTKQKGIPIVSNNDPNLYHQLTPMGPSSVKLEHRAFDEEKEQKVRFDPHQLKKEFDNQDGLEQLDGDNSEQQNSLGEDI